MLEASKKSRSRVTILGPMLWLSWKRGHFQEVRGSNPVMGKIYIKHLFNFNYVEKTRIKTKRPFKSNTIPTE